MIDFGSGPYPARKNLGTVLTNEGRVTNIHAKQLTGLAAQAHPNIQSRVPTFKRSDLPFFHPSNLPFANFQSSTLNLQSDEPSNLQTFKRANVPTFQRNPSNPQHLFLKQLTCKTL
jgi:hypothetical protein